MLSEQCGTTIIGVSLVPGVSDNTVSPVTVTTLFLMKNLFALFGALGCFWEGCRLAVMSAQEPSSLFLAVAAAHPDPQAPQRKGKRASRRFRNSRILFAYFYIRLANMTVCCVITVLLNSSWYWTLYCAKTHATLTFTMSFEIRLHIVYFLIFKL